jgi:hypothetical protein
VHWASRPSQWRSIDPTIRMYLSRLFFFVAGLPKKKLNCEPLFEDNSTNADEKAAIFLGVCPRLRLIYFTRDLHRSRHLTFRIVVHREVVKFGVRGCSKPISLNLPFPTFWNFENGCEKIAIARCKMLVKIYAQASAVAARCCWLLFEFPSSPSWDE